MKPIRKLSGFTLAELMIAAAVGILAMAAALSGIVSIQRCFVASEEFATDKREQTRLSDYLAMDLRRAISVSGPDGNILLSVEIPNYYDESGNPVTPKVTKTAEFTYVCAYGTAPLPVVYRKINSTITRTEGSGDAMVVATNVEDFECTVTGIGAANFVKTRITFLPSFGKGTPTAATRAATTVYNTVRMRNKS